MVGKKSYSPHRSTREEIEAYLTGLGRDEWKYFSASILIHWQIMFENFVPRYLSGKVLDAGCGHAPYFDLIKPYSTQLIPLDHILSHPDQKICADVSHLPLLSNSMDSVLSVQVFEHVANPFEAIREVGRVLRPGGVLLLSVPHLSRLHELPHDYFRYTENGLKQLAEAGELKIVEIVPTGGLLTFLSHQISLAFLIFFWPLKSLRPAILLFNRLFIIKFATFLDRLINTKELFPQGYILVARKS